MKRKKGSTFVFEMAVQEYVNPRLIELGFEKRKSSFFYKWQNGDAFWRIWPFLQETRGIDEAFLHMTVSVGFKHLTEFLKRWPEAPLDVDAQRPCNMTADVIYLRPTVQNPQRVSPSTSPDRLGIFIWQDIQNYALPFLYQFGTFEKAIAAWEEGKFYNAKPVGNYLLASAYFVNGDKSRALDVVRKKICEEELQANSGPAPLAPLNAAEMDLVSILGLEFDKMATQELNILRSFEQFLKKEAVADSQGKFRNIHSG